VFETLPAVHNFAGILKPLQLITMRSASPPRDGLDSGYDRNKRQTMHTRLPPTTALYCSLLKPRTLVMLQHIQTCLTLPSSVSLLREPLKTHTGINRTGELDKQKAGPNISLIKSIGWRQIIQYVSLFVIFSLLHFCFLSLSNMLSTQLATAVNLIVSIY